jgi:hypothetical protein
VFVSAVLVTDNYDGVVIPYGGFQLTQVQAGCTVNWACPGQIAVGECCDYSLSTNRDHPPLRHDAQKIHPPTLEGCGPLV